MALKLKIPVCKDSLIIKVFKWKHVPLSPVGFQISTQESWVLLLRQLEAHTNSDNNLHFLLACYGEKQISTVLLFPKKETALKIKGHRGLPENPVKLRERFQTDFATGSRWNSALQQGVVYMPMRRPSLQEPWQWLPEPSSNSFEETHGSLDSLYNHPHAEGSIYKSRLKLVIGTLLWSSHLWQLYPQYFSLPGFRMAGKEPRIHVTGRQTGKQPIGAECPSQSL